MAGVDLCALPRRSGKVAAARVGTTKALSSPAARYIIVSDYDTEQSREEAPSLIEAIQHGSAAVIGNRYGRLKEADLPMHRILLNKVLHSIAKVLDRDITDLPSGLIACNRDFANAFSKHSKSSADVVGFDWLLVSFFEGLTITELPISAEVRAPETDGIKLSRGFLTPVYYSHELTRSGHAALIRFCEWLSADLAKGSDRIEVPGYLIGLDCAIHLIRNGSNYSFTTK
jgi:hypothetical protein